jgi:hypothetical protein
MVPDGAFLVATADIQALRRSPLYATVFGEEGSRTMGLGAVESACGFDPIARVGNAVFVVPEEGDKGEFGIAASLTVTPEEIKACATKLAEARHEDTSAALTKQGEFYVMDGKGASLPRLAFKPQSETRGLLLVGKGSMVDAMMDVDAGKRAPLAPNGRHAQLRAALSRPPVPVLVLSAILPQSTREHVRSEMLPELERRSPESKELMAGVLSVTTVGASLITGDLEGTTELRATAECEAEDACAKVKTLIEKKRLELGKNFTMRLFIGPVLDGLTVEQDGKKLFARTAVPTADADRLVGRALDLSRGGRRNGGDPASGQGRDQAPPGSAPDRASNRIPQRPGPVLRAPDETLTVPAPERGNGKNDAGSQNNPAPR